MEAVIKIVNKGLTDLFGKYPGVKVYGLVTYLKKSGAKDLIPSEVNFEGEGKYIAIDDTAPMGMYHRNNSLTLRKQPNGYGDEDNDVSTYSNSLIVFYDRSKIKLSPDEVHLFVQANLPVVISLPEYKSIRFALQSVNLNSQVVYQGEYQNGKIIDPKLSMISINYQIESIFSKICFATCPE